MRPLRRATWPEVAGSERRVLLVPTGSLEQHGPHLPLATDTFVAEGVASRVHAARPAVGLAPAVPFGASGEHEGFPGTVSIGTGALCTVVVELVRYASADWDAVVVVNGHGGNADALRQAAERCRYEGRRLEVVHLGLAGMDAHAGRAETSMLLHLHPELVRTDQAEAGVTTPVADLLPALREGGVRAVSPNGVLGDPTGASEREGADWIARLEAKVLAVVDPLIAPPTVDA
ncbi:mycofactocin biosynthesis peptidyl-dipeptidase MftE [Jatrophihabitans sp. YIM 134969]